MTLGQTPIFGSRDSLEGASTIKSSTGVRVTDSTQTEINNKRSRISLRGAEVYAHHGVTSAEKDLGGRYSFDVEYVVDISEAAATDALSSAVDYSMVYETAREVVVSTQRHLLEAIVSEVADRLLEEHPTIISVVIRLRKLHAPIRGIIGTVEIEHEVTR